MPRRRSQTSPRGKSKRSPRKATSRRYRSTEAGNNLYKIQIQVTHISTQRGLTSPLYHEVEIHYIPSNATGVNPTDDRSAFEDVITKLQRAYTKEPFVVTSDAVIQLDIQPTKINLRIETSDKNEPQLSYIAQEFCQKLIVQIGEQQLLSSTRRPPPPPLDFTPFY